MSAILAGWPVSSPTDGPASLSREEAHAVDRWAIETLGIPGIVLMENAGRGAAEVLWSLGLHGRVVICCGKGNNGGDGFVMARHLTNWGVPARVLLFAAPEELAGDAVTNHVIAARMGIPIVILRLDLLDEQLLREEFGTAEWVVDALFGTGLSGAIRPPLDRVIGLINDSPARVLAVDIPSGLDCDSGEPLGATIRAQHTVTMVAPKKGFANPAARAWLGRVHVVDIGICGQ